MSRRKRDDPAAKQSAGDETASPSAMREPMAGVELFRRYLLGLVTALVVARPLVLGEDPGMLFRFTDTSNLLITLLWLVAATGWAIWLILAGKNEWYAGMVEAGLLTAVVAVFVSVSSASYKLPALLVGWEWLVLFLALFVVRQLALSEGDQRRLVAALLAGVVALSAHAIYQRGIERPEMSEERQSVAVRARDRVSLLFGVPTPSPLGAISLQLITNLELGAEDEILTPPLTGPEPRSRAIAQPNESPRANATYVDPATFAGFLALFLPALVLAAVLRWRSRGEGGTALFWLTLFSVGLAAVALVLTQNLAAIMATVLVGLALCVTVGRRWLLERKPFAIAAFSAVLAGGVLIWHFGAAGTRPEQIEENVRDLRERWSASWDMAQAHPWSGVGAANFGRHFPEYASADAHDASEDPRNFVLEAWATYGIVALLGVGVALGGYFYLVGVRLKRSTVALTEEAAEPEGTTRWEFYFGGMAGLLLGYFLREMSVSPDGALEFANTAESANQLMERGILSGFRAMIWFAAFSLFERVPWTGRIRAAALTGGVGALVVTLCFNGGISMPSLAQLLWVVVALGLCAVRKNPRKWFAGNWFLRALPIPILLGLTMAFVVNVFTPTTRSNMEAVAAMRASRAWIEQRHTGGIKNLSQHLEQKVVNPLTQASQEENDQNARRHVQLARWYGERWWQDRPQPRDNRATVTAKLLQQENHHLKAVYHAEQAIDLDPRGPDGYFVRYWLARRNALFSRAKQKVQNEAAAEQKVQNEAAADAMRRLIAYQPNNARWHYLLARALFDAGELDAALEAARRARDLDQGSDGSARQLNGWQQIQLDTWLRTKPAN